MLNLYADEQFPLPVVQLLRAFGHNILTVQEAGKGGLGIPDPEVLAFAIAILNDYTRYQALPGNADPEALPPLSQPRQSLWTSVPRQSLGTS